MYCTSIIIGPANRVTLQDLVSRYSLTDQQLDSEIVDSDIPYMTEYFDGVKIYSRAMGLTPAEQADVNKLYCYEGTQVAMTECLILWKRHDPSGATYKALLELLLRLRKDKIADDICQHLTQCEYSRIRIYNVLHTHFRVCVDYSRPLLSTGV